MKTEKSSHRKQPKQLFLVGLIVMMVLFSVSFASAWSFDNVKTSKDVTWDGQPVEGNELLEQYPPIEIKNAFGFGAVILNGYLSQHNESCGVDCSSTIEIELKETRPLVDDIDFYTILENGDRVKQDVRDYQLYLKDLETEYNVTDYAWECVDLPDYLNGTSHQECGYVEDGVHTEVNVSWIPYILGDSIVAGEYSLKIEAEKNPSRTVDWVIKTGGETLNEWAVWGNISSGDAAEVILNSPADGFNSLEPEITFNASATVTGGAGLVNMSLYTNETGTWAIRNTTTFSGSSTNFTNVNVPDSTGNNVNGKAGETINMTVGQTLTQVWKYSGSTATTVYIRTSYGGSDLATATYVGNVATFNYAMSADTDYLILNDAGGGSYDATYDNAGSKPFDEGVLTWVTGVNQAGALDPTYSRVITKLTFGEDATASIETWNRTITGDTLWNVEGCDSDGDCGFALSNNTVNLAFVPNISFETPTQINNYNSSTSFIPVNVSLTEDNFQNVTFAFSNGTEYTFTDSTRFINYSFADGTYSYNVTTWTNRGATNNTGNRNITIDTTAPSLNVTEPAGTIRNNSAGNVETLTWAYEDDNRGSCWYNYNGTNETVTCSDNTTTFVLDTNDRDIEFWANDTLGNLAYNLTTWDYRLFTISETFNATVIEGSVETFSIKFNTNGTAVSGANFYYNDTLYSASVNDNGGNNYTASVTLNIPSVDADTVVYHHWGITQTPFTELNLTNSSQTVIDFSVDDCSVHPVLLYNFTMVDEELQTIIDPVGQNTTGDLNLQVYSFGGLGSIANFSKSYSKVNPFAVCVSNNLSTGAKLNLDLQVQYSGDDYQKELYHVQNATLTSTDFGKNVSLYDLNKTDAQSFQIIFKSSSFLPVADALIEVDRKYISEGIFKTVEIPKTDENGETLASLVLNDVIYNFKIVKYGVTLGTFNNVQAVCQTPLVSPCIIDFNAISSSIVVPDFETRGDFNFTLGFDTATRILSSVFVVPSGKISNITLYVSKEDALGTSLCTDYLNSSSGTLSCTVPAGIGNTTVLAKIYKDGLLISQGNVALDKDPADTYGGILVFLAIFVMITLVGVGLSDNPVFSVMLLLVGVVLLFGLNLVANNGFIGATATILWLVLAIIIVIIKGDNRS